MKKIIQILVHIHINPIFLERWLFDKEPSL
jgi:hypothetical protein